MNDSLMNDILQEICAKKREHIAAARAAMPRAALEAQIARLPPARDFVGALRAKRDAGAFGLIAELKRASPSAGLIRPDFDIGKLAQDYAAGGAACLSVLTDAPFFQGRDADIAAASVAGLPILRKDFMLDVYQVAEARALGADCILLIMAALSDSLAAELYDAAAHYGLAVLLETHDADEMRRALRLPGGMIGINNRNLKTLRTDLATTPALAGLVPPGRMLVSESGLRDHADLCRMAEHGVGCFLVGEHLLKQPDLKRATQSLLNGST